jgi:hypothetical protein
MSENRDNTDLSYAMRRLSASRMKDGDIYTLIISLKSMIRGIEEGELNAKKVLNDMKYPYDKLKGMSIHDVALAEIENAVNPFIDEWNSRHKN